MEKDKHYESEQLEEFIKKVTDTYGGITLNQNFKINFQNNYDQSLPEVYRGFTIQILPSNGNGVGICIKFDPLDPQVCSNLLKVIEEDEII